MPSGALNFGAKCLPKATVLKQTPEKLQLEKPGPLGPPRQGGGGQQWTISGIQSFCDQSAEGVIPLSEAREISAKSFSDDRGRSYQIAGGLDHKINLWAARK